MALTPSASVSDRPLSNADIAGCAARVLVDNWVTFVSGASEQLSLLLRLSRMATSTTSTSPPAQRENSCALLARVLDRWASESPNYSTLLLVCGDDTRSTVQLAIVLLRRMLSFALGVKNTSSVTGKNDGEDDDGDGGELARACARFLCAFHRDVAVHLQDAMLSETDADGVGFGAGYNQDDCVSPGGGGGGGGGDDADDPSEKEEDEEGDDEEEDEQDGEGEDGEGYEEEYGGADEQQCGEAKEQEQDQESALDTEPSQDEGYESDDDEDDDDGDTMSSSSSSSSSSSVPSHSIINSAVLTTKYRRRSHGGLSIIVRRPSRLEQIVVAYHHVLSSTLLQRLLRLYPPTDTRKPSPRK
jgi:hypothetical protein